MISKTKTMAVFMVLVMLAVCVVPLADVQGSDIKDVGWPF